MRFCLSLLFAIAVHAGIAENADAQPPAVPSCDMQAILERNRHLFPADKEVIALPDGTAIQNPYFSRNTQNGNGATVPGRSSATISNEFEQVRQMVIDEISGGKAEADLTAQEKIMIERVKNLKLEFTNLSGTWASNFMTNQTIRLYENATKLPRLSMISVLAHEIGHSLDFCNLNNPYYRKTRKGREHLPLQSALAAGTGGSSVDSNDLEIELNKAAHSSCTHMIAHEPSLLRAFRHLSDNGYIEQIDAGIPLEHNPARRAYICLAQNADYESLPVSHERACQGPNFIEAGAQIWGARLLARWVEKNPPQNDLERLGALAASLPEKKKGNLKNAKEKDFDEIYLSEPALQKMFNCQPKPNQNCMRHFTPSTEGNPNSPAKHSSENSAR